MLTKTLLEKKKNWLAHVVLQLPFISPLKNTLETLQGARGGSCEPCQESKEAIKLYIVDYTGPLSALFG